MTVKFGPSGNSDSFYEQGYKSSIQAPKWISQMGLNAYEYQCSKGIHISKTNANELGNEADKYGINLSIHAPYFISLASQNESTREKSVQYIIDTLAIAQIMGAKRIVVHPGSCSKMSRSVAIELAKETLSKVIDQAKEMKLDHIHICPETMGKINQLGTLEEVMDICKMNNNFLPTIDFGHINARGFGGLKEYEDYERIFDVIENSLGYDRLNIFHSHYSRIEFTEGGEKKHWTYADIQYGPEFEPIAELIYKKNLSPTIICESRGTMTEDVVKMKEIYLSFVGV